MDKIKLFKIEMPIYSSDDQYDKDKFQFIHTDKVEFMLILFKPGETGMFGLDTIRLKAVYDFRKTEIDIPSDKISQYPNDWVEKKLVYLITQHLNKNKNG